MDSDIISKTVEALTSLRHRLSSEEVQAYLSRTPDEIDLADSVEELKRLFYIHRCKRDQGEERAYYRLNKLLLKMIEEEETVSGIKKLYKASSSGSQAKSQAFLKWHELSLEEMKSAKNSGEIERASKNAPLHSEANHIYAKRMLEFAKTPEEANEMWGYDGGETIRRIADLLKDTG